MRSRWWPRVSWAMAGTSLTWMGLAGGQPQQGDAGRPQDDQEESGQDEGGDGDDHGHLGAFAGFEQPEPAAFPGGVGLGAEGLQDRGALAAGRLQGGG